MHISRSVLASVCLSCSLSLTLLGPAPAHADLAPEEAAPGCWQPTLDATIASCSAAIESGSLSGRPLAAAYAQRGAARTLKRSLDEAQADLDQAIKIDPTYAVAYANRANFFTVSKKPDRAMADAEEALRLDSNLPNAHFVHGSAALNLGQYDLAIAEYTETLRLRPAIAEDVLSSRGYAYHRKGDDAKAVADYTELLKIKPDNVGTLLNRGDALLKLRDTTRQRRLRRSDRPRAR